MRGRVNRMQSLSSSRANGVVKRKQVNQPSLASQQYSIRLSTDDLHFLSNDDKVKEISIMSEALALRGVLKGHGDWVTSLATTQEDPNLLLSSSRDKSVIVWHLTHSGEEEGYGYARRALRGHSHFVSDVVISSDGAFALSASWDSELRLWDISSGKTTRRFVGHEKDVLSVAFSVDNRQIVSGMSSLRIMVGL